MESYTNDKGEVVIIKNMEARRLIHAIAKYAVKAELEKIEHPEFADLVKVLKDEAIGRLTPQAQ